MTCQGPPTPAFYAFIELPRGTSSFLGGLVWHSDSHLPRSCSRDRETSRRCLSQRSLPPLTAQTPSCCSSARVPRCHLPPPSPWLDTQALSLHYWLFPRPCYPSHLESKWRALSRHPTCHVTCHPTCVTPYGKSPPFRNFQREFRLLLLLDPPICSFLAPLTGRAGEQLPRLPVPFTLREKALTL